MAQLDPRARVLQEWFRIPESRRRDATDAVAFAFRLLREHPELLSDRKELSPDRIVEWLLPYLHKVEGQ